MENSSTDQKPRAVSENHVNQNPPHIRERSLTDIQTINKKDASTNTTPIFISELLQRALPPIPLTTNQNYGIYEIVTEPDVEISSEHIYKEIVSKNNFVCQWNAKSVADGQPNQEVTGEERNQETNEDYKEKEMSRDYDLNGLSKTHQTNSHKRNESSWSLGSFFIGPPIELTAEVLSGEEWARFFEINPELLPDPISTSSMEPNPSTHDVVNGESTNKQTKSTDENMEIKITEDIKVSSEEPNRPHRLPPKLSRTSSFSSAQDSIFRSSIFYKLPPPGQELPVNTPKSGPSALKKFKAKLRKLPAEEAQLKATLE